MKTTSLPLQLSLSLFFVRYICLCVCECVCCWFEMQIRLSYLNSTSSSPYLIPLAILSLIELSSSLAQSLIHSSSTFCKDLHLQVYSITGTRALPDCIISNYACTLFELLEIEEIEGKENAIIDRYRE